MDVDLRVLELWCSRLCHDLAGPVGAINNGVELMEGLGTGLDAEAMALIGESARSAARRLQFFRMAYGLAGGRGAAMAPDELRAILGPVLAEHKVTLAWPTAGSGDEAPLAPGAARLVLNLALLAADTLPRGGRVELALALGADETRARVHALGAGARIEEGVRAALTGATGAEGLDARSVHAFFTARLAEAHGGTLVLDPDATDSPVFSAILPAAR